jgi:D-alanyl-D-alanine carboxypeptidase
MAIPEIGPFGKRLSAWIIGLAVLVGLASIVTARGPYFARSGRILPISPTLCEDMRNHHVMKAGAPVGCERLKLIDFSYVGFDGQAHDDGEIVVMDAAAEHVLHIFGALRERRFPIAKAQLMNRYDGNDDASMADNNTSAFNVREITGGGLISLHTYGLAIDINPVQNPYAKRSGATLTFSPPAGAEYVNRINDRPWKDARPGMAEAVVDSFAFDGFLIWGGYWDDPIDYQHFQVSRTLAERLARLSPAQAQAVFDRHVRRYRACRRTSASRSYCITSNETPNGIGD